ncbi:MAG: hypothetical protein ACJ74Z_14680 [Bryobacteraceae bacterium]
MEKRLGPSAGILAVLAVLVHILGNSVGEQQGGSRKKASTAVSSTPVPNDTNVSSKQGQGPWRATQQYFHASPEGLGREYQSCLSQPTSICVREILLGLYGFPAGFPEQNIHTLIATAPDPLHTRMAIETDRYLDAIQQAAFRSDWELATQWLPWTAEAKAAPKTDSKDSSPTAFDTERLPGLLVFRPHFVPYINPDSLLLVFVVGETPTAGINGFQFQLARQTLTRLGSYRPNTLFIAGPNFSGSFLSLTHLLEEYPASTHFELHSGSVANSDYARAMLLRLQSQGFALTQDDSVPMSTPAHKPVDPQVPNPPSVTFHGSTLPSASFHHHFVRLAKTFGLKPDQVAELVEDETGFSFTDPDLHPDMDTFPIATYRYPRDIAQLRNVYNDTAFAGPSAQSGTKPPSAVEFSLKDTQSGEDTFPMFSTSHTPLSQDAELEQIVGFLNRRSARLVSLSATNVFDALFLANVLTHKCPDTRIVLQGPDLLFVQDAAQGALSGVMAISPFPLFPEGAEWSRAGAAGALATLKRSADNNASNAESAPDVVTFATSDQIGEFDAVLSLLQSRAVQNPDRQSFEAAFAPDSPAQHRPKDTVRQAMFSAWVLALGPAGWLPIDLYGQMNEKLLPIKRPAALWFDPKDAPPHQANLPLPLPKAKLGWTALCLSIVMFSFAFCGAFFYINLDALKLRALKLHSLKLDSRSLVWSVLCISDLDSAERRRAVNEIVHTRYLCMLSCFASLAVVNGLLLCPMWAAHLTYGGSIAPVIEALVALAYALSIGTAIYLSFFVPLRICPEGPLGTCPVNTPISWWSLVLRVGILALSLGCVYLWWWCCNNGVPGYFLCFRTRGLAAPVCPIWPLLLMTCGLLTLAYFHLRRFTWGDRRQPHLETSVFDEALCNEFSDLKTELDLNLLRPFSETALPGVPSLILSAVLIILVLWMLFTAASLQSFEPHWFSWLVGVLLLPLFVFTLLSFLRFVRCWRILRAFLVSLNSVVLGRFFMRIPEFGGSGPVWIREVKLMSLATAINSAIALHNLEKTCPSFAYTAEFVDKLRKFLSPQGGHGTGLDLMCAYNDFRETAKAITGALGNAVLRPYWRNNKLPFVGTGAAEPSDVQPPKTEALAEVAAAATVGGGPVQPSSFTPGPADLKALSVNPTTAMVQAEATPDKTQEGPSVSTEAHEYAAKYVALQYSVYIGYVLHQLQNLLLCFIGSFVFLVAALNSFSFQTPQAIFRFLMVMLVIGAVAVLRVFAQMERDPILSRLSGTTGGELGKDFYLRALTYGALPVLTVLSTQFPAISRFLAAWIQPASTAIH